MSCGIVVEEAQKILRLLAAQQHIGHVAGCNCAQCEDSQVELILAACQRTEDETARKCAEIWLRYARDGNIFDRIRLEFPHAFSKEPKA